MYIYIFTVYILAVWFRCKKYGETLIHGRQPVVEITIGLSTCRYLHLLFAWDRCLNWIPWISPSWNFTACIQRIIRSAWYWHIRMFYVYESISYMLLTLNANKSLRLGQWNTNMNYVRFPSKVRNMWLANVLSLKHEHHRTTVSCDECHVALWFTVGTCQSWIFCQKVINVEDQLSLADVSWLFSIYIASSLRLSSPNAQEHAKSEAARRSLDSTGT